MRGRIKIIVFVLAVISSALFVSRAFIYDTNIAHPGLTKLAAELYNQQGGQLTSQEIKWLQQGAIEEDTPFRWMNHFFDPIHNAGLKSSYDTAKKWAGNASNQASYSKGDQTWQRAVYYWQKGDKGKAMIALGHILHLLEDMTVPAHTRDDAHPEGDPYEVWVKNNFKAINGEWMYFDKLDKYFDYLANYSNNNFYSEDTIESKKFTKISIVNDEWVDIGGQKFRKYFFSKIDSVKFKLFLSTQDFNWQSVITGQDIGGVLTVKDDFVSVDYYTLLAPKAIGAGAGLIKLFFEEVQKQQAYEKPFWQINPLGIAQGETVGTVENLGNIYQNTSAQLGNLWNAGKKLLWNAGDANITYDFFTELLATNIVLAQEMKNLEQAGQNLATVPVKIVAETGKAIEDVIRDSSVASLPQNDTGGQNTAGIALPAGRQVRHDAMRVIPSDGAQEDLLAGFAATPSVSAPVSVKKNSSAPPAGGAQNDNANKSSVAYSGGGSSWSSSAPAEASGASAATDSSATPAGEIASSTAQNDNSVQDILKQVQDNNNEPLAPPSDTTPPDAPIIITPAASHVYTTSSAFTLAGSVSTDTIKLFLNSQEIPTGVAMWNTEANLNEGENIFAFTAADIAGNISATSSVKIIKDTTGPITLISIKRTSAKELQISWQGDDNNGSGIVAYDLDYQTADIGAPTSSWTNWKTSATSTVDIFAVEFGKQYQFRVRAADALGNVGNWAQSSAQEIALPHVVINEIAWAGTKANANDEWMELYNSADYDFDASDWMLTDGNDIKITFATGTVIKSQQYFLMERTNNQTISDIVADLIYTGSLHNSGEKLQLKDAQGRILDEVSASNGWFVGKSDNEKNSMERLDPSISGSVAGNWQSVGLPARRGRDAKNNFISGTPKKFNSSFNYLNGSTTGDKILSAQFSPYFLGNFTVATGTTLTIPAGVIIKSGRPSASDGFLRVYGALVTQGTVVSPVVFTSYRDATQAGNTNPWNDSQIPTPSDWNRLQFYPGSSATLVNTQILYGNYRSKTTDTDGALLADGANINATGLTVKWARATDTAVNLINSSSTLANCVITQNYKGIAASNGLLSVGDCLFENNGLQAIYSAGAGISLKNNTFTNNGWDNGKLSWWNQSPYGPMAVRDTVPEIDGNNFISNAVNAIDWGGTISASGTLKIANDWPLVSNGFTVAAGVTFQIQPGTVFKMKPGANIIINGAMEANGLPEKKIIFTSWRDDSDGHDSNGNNASSTPNPIGLEWQQMKFENAATSTLDNVIIRYANQSFKISDPNGSLYINNTPITVNNLLLEYSSIPGAALHLKNANQAEIKNSVIKNYAIGTLSQPTIGLKIDAGAPKISSTIVDTFTNGLQILNSPDLSGVSVEYINAP